jgi:hypothetical protein
LRASFVGNDATVACRTFDVASARRWLAEGVPLADAITMLEIRRRFEFSPDDCRVYAIESVLIAQREYSRSKHQQIAHQKEVEDAVA